MTRDMTTARLICRVFRCGLSLDSIAWAFKLKRATVDRALRASLTKIGGTSWKKSF